MRNFVLVIDEQDFKVYDDLSALSEMVIKFDDAGYKFFKVIEVEKNTIEGTVKTTIAYGDGPQILVSLCSYITSKIDDLTAKINNHYHH